MFSCFIRASSVAFFRKHNFNCYSDEFNKCYNHPEHQHKNSKNKEKACFHGDTLIALAASVTYKGKPHHVHISLRQLYEATNQGQNVIKVWSFNLAENLFEPKLARVLYTGKKQMDQLLLSDNGSVIATPDHEFLYQQFLNPQATQVQYSFVPNNQPTYFDQVLLPFNAEFGCKISSRKFVGEHDAYTLQVEQNNNYVVVSKLTKNYYYSGFVVKNCGDVEKL